MPSLQVNSGRPSIPPKKRSVQRVKDLIQIVEMALGAEEALAAACAANQFGLASDGGAGGKPLVAQIVGGVDGLFVKLGQEDVGDGADHGFLRAFQKVRETDENLAVAQTNARIQRGKPAEADREGRHRRPGAQRAVLLLKDGN
jgi:hypothetical protein